MSDKKDKENELKKRLQKVVLADNIKEVLISLSEREVKVLRQKFGIDLDTCSDLEEVVKNFDVTRERIKEIEEKALKKLRNKGPSDDGPGAA